MQGGTAKATAAADRRIAVAVAFDSLQMSIRAPLPPLPQPPKGIGTFKSWALDIYVCKCYIFFFSSFRRRRRSLRVCVLRVRAHANRAVEMTQELIAFRRYMVPQGVV